MASNGFLQKPTGSALLYKRRKGSLSPFIPVLTGTDTNVRETDLITYAYWEGYTPSVATIDFVGNTASIVNKFNGTATVGTIRYTFNTATLVSTDIWAFTGRGYSASLEAVYTDSIDISFAGRGYNAALESYGGFRFEGTGYAANVTFALTPDYNIWFNAGGYQASLVASIPWNSDIQFTGRGYSASLESYGGFRFEGRGYAATLSSTVLTSEAITFTGTGYSASLTAIVDAPTTITFVGRGYEAVLYREPYFIGRGYAVQPQFSLTYDAAYAEAFVMNLITTAVSRYENYPFIHVAKIGTAYYGVKADGLYELKGTLDITTPVDGHIQTNGEDFGTYQSKNVPYIYLDGDDDYQVTPVVDGVDQPVYSSGFSGRRARLARGPKGRYWSFKINGITHLQGIEYMPDGLSRKVK